MRLKDVKLKVRSILKEKEETRNNDGHLLAHYVAKYYPRLVDDTVVTNKTVSLGNFRYFPPVETITRARRIIQNVDKEFLPTTEAVRKARRIKEQDYKNWEVREASQHNIKEDEHKDSVSHS